MKKRIPLARQVDHLLLRDITFLFIASCFVMVRLFDYPFGQALVVSPLVVGAVLLALYLAIQVSWYCVVMLDKLLMRLNIGNHNV